MAHLPSGLVPRGQVFFSNPFGLNKNWDPCWKWQLLLGVIPDG